MNKPNFFIVGAMKSGTSSLHAILNMHPEIFMCNPKEPSFFVNNKDLRKLWPEMARKKISFKIENYLDLFKNSAGAKIIGESSTNYSKIPDANGVAERIFHFNKNSKILYIIRDPITRTISHYWHAVRRSGKRELRSLLKAIKSNSHYINVSNYAMQIKPYIDLFGNENVKCITLEKFSSDPQKEIENILSWLEVSQECLIPSCEHKLHVTENIVQKTRFRCFVPIDNYHARKFINTICPFFLKKPFHRLLRKEIDRSKIDLNETIEELRFIFIPLVDELSTLLDNEFTEWTNFYNRLS